MSSNRKKVLYVGGLEENVTEEILYSAFIPFGDLKEVNIPKDFTANKHKGFGFVEFEDTEDAQEALENMDGAEIFGKVVRCNFAKPMTKVSSGKAVWSSEDWLKNSLQDGEDPSLDSVLEIE